MKQQKARKSFGACITIALILATAILFLSFGALKLSDVFAAGTTVVCKNGGTYDVTQSNMIYNCCNLATLTDKTFNIKSNVSSVTFVGTADRQIFFMDIIIEERTDSLNLYLENMCISGQADKTTIYAIMENDWVYIHCSGKTYVRGGNRTFLNDDFTKPQDFCCAVESTNLEITGSGTIEFAGGQGFPWTGAQGGFAFFGTNLTISAPNVTLRGGNGGLGTTGADDATTGATGKIGGTGGDGGRGGDGRAAVFMPINGNLHIPENSHAIMFGGDGGEGGKGGTGGQGGPGKNGSFLVNPITGGRGGTGGQGGRGGNGMIPVLIGNTQITGAGYLNGVQLLKNQKLDLNLVNTQNYIGANGNGGVGGNGGTGGNGSYSMYGNPKNNPGEGGSGGQGGDPGTGGRPQTGTVGSTGSAGVKGNPRP